MFECAVAAWEHIRMILIFSGTALHLSLIDFESILPAAQFHLPVACVSFLEHTLRFF